jgi:hypothetical protein
MWAPDVVTAPRSAEDQAITDAVIQRIEADPLISAGSASTPFATSSRSRPRRNDVQAERARATQRAGVRGRQPVLASGRIALREDRRNQGTGDAGLIPAASARIS